MKGRAMAQAVIRQPLTAEARVNMRFVMDKVALGQGHWDRFLSEFFGLPL
jgi:hypothetical protein